MIRHHVSCHSSFQTEKAGGDKGNEGKPVEKIDKGKAKESKSKDPNSKVIFNAALLFTSCMLLLHFLGTSWWSSQQSQSSRCRSLFYNLYLDSFWENITFIFCFKEKKFLKQTYRLVSQCLDYRDCWPASSNHTWITTSIRATCTLIHNYVFIRTVY